ncbi:hypothetical protein COLO4_16318 [Corchorus olitorius]|uniref:Uncharacterized protein n=1 Tax=Corchorus olitorius TaxID=93759 RepID=A0A1R3JI06_9ROSI|nr:hypothetical protein COLO4_16318 [Corchorus olitorius]
MRDDKKRSQRSGSPALQLKWSVRQCLSKQALRKKGEPALASPTTPLSWSGGTSVSKGGVGADGSEESSRPPLKPLDNARSKQENQSFPKMRVMILKALKEERK